jgi:nitroreductase
MTTDILTQLRGLRQSRRFLDTPVPAADLTTILEIARWTGSAKNTQPWEFIVVEDKAMNVKLSETEQFTAFLANVPLSIVIVLNGDSRSVSYDEGRVSERIMLAAQALGLGSGTGWFGLPESRETVRELLGIPADKVAWSAVGLGYTDVGQQQSTLSGRKPLAELVSYGHYGKRTTGDS